MANMSYCRFRNTLGDLLDCLETLNNVGDESLSKEEASAARQLMKEMINFVEENFDSEELDNPEEKINEIIEEIGVE